MSPSSPIRVMIVDDSLIVRRLVKDSLDEVQGIEVVATASNGRLALERIPEARPDVVTLDVEMPELDGISTLRRIKAAHPHVHVIMFSSMTDRAAAATMEALAAGAADYATKPTGGGMTATRERIREQLVPKIRALCARDSAMLPTTRRMAVLEPPPTAFRTAELPRVGRVSSPPRSGGLPLVGRVSSPPRSGELPAVGRAAQPPGSGELPAVGRAAQPPGSGELPVIARATAAYRSGELPAIARATAAYRSGELPVIASTATAEAASLTGGSAAPLPAAQVVALGVSTGGPAALRALLSALPPLPVPMLIVQHLPAAFTSELARQLAKVAQMPVMEAYDGELLVPGRVWLAPGDRHLVVQRTTIGVQLRLDDGPPENSCRPAVDVLFRTVAAAYGTRALGVVLTGMGQDGLKGCEAIRSAGGRVFAQDAGTAVVWGMAGAVARAGLADRILPLGSLARAIEDVVGMPRDAARATGGPP